MKKLLRKLSLRRSRLHRDIEKTLGYRFRDQSLLTTALTHRSYRFENNGVEEDNQRLEFLGDAVLGLLAASAVYSLNPPRDEGWLTAMRSRMISGKALAETARLMGIGTHLRIGRGEERSGGRSRQSNLADALEAVMGAIFLDGGLDAAEKVFKRLRLAGAAASSTDFWIGNPKGRLQEYCQRIQKTTPTYEITCVEGPAHNAVFTARVRAGGICALGKGRSKQEAEKNAAINALASLSNQNSALQ